MSYRDETEALRARVRILERDLAEARREATQDQNTVTALLQARIKDQDRTIAEFNDTVANLRDKLTDARGRARMALFEDWWDKAKIAFFFGLGAGLLMIVVYAALSMSSPVAGFVVSRHHRHPRSRTTCTGRGASRRCNTTYTSERWTLHVAGDSQVVEHEVPEDEWNRTAIGSWYCLRPEQGCPPIPSLDATIEE